MVCDFHCHSTISDGTLPPELLVERAKQSGISTLALTDHDDVRGIEPSGRAPSASSSWRGSRSR
jgi:predicted metal-dependent phosphoesterase TrpH